MLEEKGKGVRNVGKCGREWLERIYEYVTAFVTDVRILLDAVRYTCFSKVNAF